MSRKLIRQAVAHFGSQEKLGAAIGYSQHGVMRAVHSGRITPVMAYAIHAASRGLFHYRDLCPVLDSRAQLKAVRRRLKANGGRR